MMNIIKTCFKKLSGDVLLLVNRLRLFSSFYSFWLKKTPFHAIDYIMLWSVHGYCIIVNRLYPVLVCFPKFVIGDVQYCHTSNCSRYLNMQNFISLKFLLFRAKRNILAH